MEASEFVTLWNAAPELAMIVGLFVLVRYIWAWAQQRDAANSALVKALNESYVALVREAVTEFRNATAQSTENGRALSHISDQIRGLYDLIGNYTEGGNPPGARRSGARGERGGD